MQVVAAAVEITAEQDVIAAGRVMVELGRVQSQVLHSVGHLTVVQIQLLVRL